MTRARVRALGGLVVVLVAAAAFALRPPQHRQPAAGQRDKPPLLLLTSLPLLFDEDFGLENNGSPALTALGSSFEVLPISTTSPSELAKARLLLMAQPPAQTAENLVALDSWVRRGGHVLLLADPMLEWPSKRPLGDPLRPAPMFTDTGLLAHWGLRLDAPDAPGKVVRSLGGYDVITISPGTLEGKCNLSSDRLVADCQVGKGRAIIVADADLLNAGALGDEAQQNLTGIASELARLNDK
ncbi:MAG: hypothetical protein ACJ8FB_13465 [Sphingomicrobium sp.]